MMPQEFGGDLLSLTERIFDRIDSRMTSQDARIGAIEVKVDNNLNAVTADLRHLDTQITDVRNTAKNILNTLQLDKDDRNKRFDSEQQSADRRFKVIITLITIVGPTLLGILYWVVTGTHMPQPQAASIEEKMELLNRQMSPNESAAPPVEDQMMSPVFLEVPAAD